jgi:hypothetical protein
MKLLHTLFLGALVAGFAAAQSTGEYHLSGPFTHENLTIFLIHGPNRINHSLLTLEEAIDQHKVVVYETRSVNELAIENISGEDVFIESGDIVKGGAQDRTLKDDLILPAKSGRVSIASFCVEHGRWTKRGNESVSTFGGAHQAVASKEMKMAVKMKADQQEVWNQVAQSQARIARNLPSDPRAPASPTSFAMTMDAPVVQRSTDGYLQELSGIVNHKSDVVGYAFAINGKVNSADIYGSHELFGKLWMKLLRASAFEAVTDFEGGKKFDGVEAKSITWVVNDADGGKSSVNDLTERTEIITRETAKNVMFETRDRAQKGVWIHKNYLTK